MAAIMILGFYLWLAAQIPYTSDDWCWGLQKGITQLVTGEYNSRYSSNFIEVVLTRSEILKTFVVGSVFFMIPLTAALVSRPSEPVKSKLMVSFNAFLVCNILLMSMRVSMWQQTYGWIAGFSCYVVSALFVCIFWFFSSDLFEETSSGSDERTASLAAVYAFCVAMQLFLENVTTLMVFTSAVFLIAAWRKYKKAPAKYIAMLAGNVTGAIIMFSNSIFGQIVSTGEAVHIHEALLGIRQLSFDKNDSIQHIAVFLAKNFATVIAPFLWEKNWIICIAISAFLIPLIVRNKEKARKPVWAAACAANMLLIFYFYINYSAGRLHLVSDNLTICFHVAINFGFFILVAVEVFAFLEDKRLLKYKLLVLWLSAPAAVAPMVLFTGLGPRAFFTSNMFLILFALTVWTEVLSQAKSIKMFIPTAASAVIAFSLFSYVGHVYYAIGAMNAERYRIIAEATETDSKEIVMPGFPHQEYVWRPYPEGAVPLKEFKEFYGIPDSVAVNFEDTSNVEEIIIWKAIY